MYSDRCKFWIAESERNVARHVREREAAPIILTGHGLALRVEKGSLLIRDGHTHFPAQQRKHRFFPAALDVPPAVVILDGSGDITLSAIDWLAAQGIPLIRLRWNGKFASVLTSGGQAASASKVHWQQTTRDNPRARLAFGANLVREKAKNSLQTLEEYIPPSPLRDQACAKLAYRAKLLSRKPPRTFASLLGFEGAIAGDYFRVWTGIPLKWKSLKRHPISEEWNKYRSRIALRYGIRLHGKGGGYNRGATHPVNAMLNYAYSVLIARLQIRLIADGYDPMLGIMHQKKQFRGTSPAFALDHMEPMRPVVDRAVLRLINEMTFTGADFSIQRDGVCRLNPELARRVAQLAMEYCEILELPKRSSRYQRRRSP
ncbi:MAG: CRISPR-associated endonuclease Cas1 [Burkholderiales bacterium]